ncbi:MAG: hypothetical protein NWF04_10695 [Candidatus Bathyarchaeota archaeon]|nr:hypothetical protein [Candidatus Bathyarchaeota archaeon]
MKLKLNASRKTVNRVSGPQDIVVFTVVDLDKAKTYPANFVCMLPKLDSTGKSASVFSELFGEDRVKIAKTLLTKALSEEDSPEIKAEIEKRLKALEPKVLEVPCKICGQMFKPKKFGRYQQKICQTCRAKRHAP